MRTKVVVFVKNGIVTDVYSSDERLEVEVIDCDIDSETDEEAYKLMEEAARGANYLLDIGDLTAVY